MPTPIGPATEISPEGWIVALGDRRNLRRDGGDRAGGVVGSAVAAVGELEGRCVRSGARAALATGSVIALASGVAIAVRLRRRPVAADASSRYVWWLGGLFAVAVVVASWHIPSFTCEQAGSTHSSSGAYTRRGPLRRHGGSSRRNAIFTAGLVGGVTIAAVPRFVRAAVPIVAVTWFGVLAWIVAGRPSGGAAPSSERSRIPERRSVDGA